jgi:hypothetical protein
MNKKVESQADKKKKLALQKKYGQRITIARQGREYFSQKDYVNAAKKYNEYLGILAELNEVDEIYKLTPAMFDQKTQVTEMLLISHIYWELARVHEMTPKLQVAYNKCLTQFIKFTANQPYQVLNAEMLRKYIKKNKNNTPQLGTLNNAYQQIFVQSKKCYISTLCFGQHGHQTLVLREFKSLLLTLPFGQSFVAIYYKYSSSLVTTCDRNLYLKKFTTFFFKPLLHCFAKVLKLSIFR